MMASALNPNIERKSVKQMINSIIKDEVALNLFLLFFVGDKKFVCWFASCLDKAVSKCRGFVCSEWVCNKAGLEDAWR